MKPSRSGRSPESEIKGYLLATTPNFERSFNKLDVPTARRVTKKLRWLAAHSEMIAEPLRHLSSELAGLYKYRVGDYRILFWVDRARRVITLYTVKHRSIVYEEL